MANYLSAGVYGTEIDLSVSVPAVATGISAYAGEFTKGPSFKRTLVTTVDQLISKFGLPTDSNYNDWFQCKNFLRNGSELYIVRAVNNDIEHISKYPDYVEGKTYYAGEGAYYLGANIKALVETSHTPTVNAGVVVTDSNWEKLLSVSVSEEKSLNAGMELTPTGAGIFYSSYTPNDNIFDLQYNSDLLSGSAAIRFVSKSTGTSGNNIKISLSNDMSKGIESPVSTLWVGNTALYKGVFVSGTSYGIGDIVSYEYNLYTSTAASNTDAPKNSANWILSSHKNNDVVYHNGANWYSLISNNGDEPSTSSSKWAKGTTFDDLFEPSLTTDEIALVIFDGEEIVEKYILSTKETGTDQDGNNIFIDNILNDKSAYLYSKTKTSAIFPTLIQQKSLHGGKLVDPLMGDLIEAYNLFGNPEDFDCSIIIANENINQFCIDLAKQRSDCITIAGAPKSIVGSLSPTEDLVTYMTEEVNVENSYASFYGNYIQIFDAYNSKYRWINIAGAVAGQQVKTNNDRDPWWANAGLERGQILDVIKISFNATKGERDVLYRNKINPVVSFPGQGNCIIWGQKTLLSRKSAFDRLNVRQLFLVIEKSVNKAMKYFVFEPNDEFTRAQIVAMIVPFLEDIKGRRGVYDYKVIADETINTPEVIDNNILKVNILIKPTRVAEFIEVKYVATKTGANLSELAKTIF